MAEHCCNGQREKDRCDCSGNEDELPPHLSLLPEECRPRFIDPHRGAQRDPSTQPPAVALGSGRQLASESLDLCRQTRQTASCPLWCRRQHDLVLRRPVLDFKLDTVSLRAQAEVNRCAGGMPQGVGASFLRDREHSALYCGWQVQSIFELGTVADIDLHGPPLLRTCSTIPSMPLSKRPSA